MPRQNYRVAGPNPSRTTSSAAARTSFRKMPRSDIGRAHEIGDELAVGALIDFVGFAELKNSSAVHHRDPIREQNTFHLIVGDI